MEDKDIFDIKNFVKNLKTNHIGRHFVYKRTTKTTMDDALQLAKKGASHGTFILSEHQTKARGYKGHSFNATNSGNIYASLILHIPISKDNDMDQFEAFVQELAAALAARSAVEAMGLQRVTIKWPNDLWVRGHKLAGFLVEIPDYVIPDLCPQTQLFILGIGLNVNSDLRRDSSLAPIATSVACELGGKPMCRETLLAELCNRLEINIQKSPEQLYEEFLEYTLFRPGDCVTVHSEEEGSTLDANIIEITDTWTVILEYSGGIQQEIFPHQLVSLRPKTSQTVVFTEKANTENKFSSRFHDLLHSVVNKTSTAVECSDVKNLQRGNFLKKVQVIVLVDEAALHVHSFESSNIISFVKNGGGIIFIGATAVFAQSWFPQLKLKVHPMMVNTSTSLRLSSPPKEVIDGFFCDAQSRYFEITTEENIFAYYHQTGQPAVVYFSYGKGTLFLCGIHIENLQSSKSLDKSLFKRDTLVQEMLEMCGLK